MPSPRLESLVCVWACSGPLVPSVSFPVPLSVVVSLDLHPSNCSKLTLVLVNASDQKFTTAAIFCGVTTLVGILITVAPVIVRRINDLMHADKDPDVSEKQAQDA